MSGKGTNVVGATEAGIVSCSAARYEVNVQKPSMSLVSSVETPAMITGVDAVGNSGRDAITATDERYTIDWPNCR